MASIDSARAAKIKALRLFARKRHVGGIGITRLGTKYAIQVNLEAPQTARQVFPPDIDGVPVVVRVTGVIKKQVARRKRLAKDGGPAVTAPKAGRAHV